MRRELLSHTHNGWVYRHAGAEKMVLRLTQKYWWPGITNHAAEWVKHWRRWQDLDGKPRTPSPLVSLPIPYAFGDRVYIDLFGPLKTSPEGKKYIMVITDALTKYTRLTAIPDISAGTVTNAFFETWITNHAIPKLLISDKGKEFCNEILDSLCKKFGI